MKKFSSLIIASLMSVSIWATEGALLGRFTINANGDQVVFSQGNLQASYNGSEWKWFFAKHQWDYIDDKSGNISIDDEGKIPANDTVDLFGWSTPATYYGINNSVENSTYAGKFEDWGNNIGEGWRTLSRGEWMYLFHERDKADELFGLGTINGIKGTIILPDDWTLPDGAIFNKAKDKNLVWYSEGYYRNSNHDNFSHNTYTVEQWSTMEKAGAVFLPAARNRVGKGVYGGGDGDYWSSTSYDAANARYVYFVQDYFGPQNYDYRYYGQSVRLVQAAPEGPEAIDEITNDQSSITNKIIKDNQLLIQRGDKTFNAIGTQVK